MGREISFISKEDIINILQAIDAEEYFDDED